MVSLTCGMVAGDSAGVHLLLVVQVEKSLVFCLGEDGKGFEDLTKSRGFHGEVFSDSGFQHYCSTWCLGCGGKFGRQAEFYLCSGRAFIYSTLFSTLKKQKQNQNSSTEMGQSWTRSFCSIKLKVTLMCVCMHISKVPPSIANSLSPVTGLGLEVYG